MFNSNEGKKLFHGAGIRGYCALLCFSIAIIFSPGCIYAEDPLKVSVNGDSIILEKSFVKYVNIEMDDMKYARYIVVHFSPEGDEALCKLFARNLGKTISWYFGQRLIRTGTHIIEAYPIRSVWFDLRNANDEAMARKLIKTYPEFKLQE